MTEPTLLLTRSDLRRLVGQGDYFRAVEQAFRASASGEARSPPPLHIESRAGGFHCKGAMLRRERTYVAVKVNSNFPDNAQLHELPTIQGALLLFDGDNGSVLAVMDSAEITVMRTAAATALAAQYLAREDSSILTVCGCGEQARAQAAALSDVRRFKRGFAWDIAAGRARSFAADMSELLGFPIDVAPSLGDATRNSDVIVTCTTAREPFIDETLVKPGSFIAAVGADSPAKNEIAPSLMAIAAVFADVTDQAVVMGDTLHAIASGAMALSDIRGELADLVSGRMEGRTGDDEIIIFDSTGTAIEDVASAAIAYERARSSDVQRIELAGE